MWFHSVSAYKRVTASVPLRPLRSSSSHRAQSGQYELWPRQDGVCQAPVEHVCRPGCSRPPLQGQLELDCSRTAVCFVPDEEEEDGQRGEEQRKLCKAYSLLIGRRLSVSPNDSLRFDGISFLCELCKRVSVFILLSRQIKNGPHKMFCVTFNKLRCTADIRDLRPQMNTCLCSCQVLWNQTWETL